MKIRDYGRLNSFFGIMAAVALVLALVGIFGLPSTPYSGFEMTPDGRAFHVDPAGPAALAGLKDGDAVVQIGEVSTDRLHDLAAQNRPRIGEVLKVSVLRDSLRHEFSIMLAKLPPQVAFRKWGTNLMALAMLALGLAVYWYRPSKPSSLFFLSNLCFGLAFTTPPYFQQHIMRTLVSTGSILFLTMGLAFLLHLSAVLPKPKALLRETNIVEYLIYLPAPIMAIFFLALQLIDFQTDLLVNLVLHQGFVLMLLICVGLALSGTIHSLWVATSAERSQGLGWLVVGFVLGAVPPAADSFMKVFLPNSTLPGQSYYSMTAILASLGFGWVLWRSITTRGETINEEPARPIVFKKASGQ
ncbi:MAG TPA: hypothetical protein VMW38_15575 [Terriglobia bacterium]|nr:hypothetical protein [Terriglobia bacterium]